MASRRRVDPAAPGSPGGTAVVSLTITGALAASIAVICLILIPLGSYQLTSFIHPERALLREAGWTRSMLAWEGVRAAATLCGIAVAAGLGASPVGLLGALVPSIVARALVSRRHDARAAQTLTAMQLTLAGLRSGASLPEALRLATRSVPETVFSDALRSFDLGAPLDVALRAARSSLDDRRVTPGLEALSLCVSERLPAARCAMLIASAVDRLVFERRLRDDVRSRTSGLRVQIALLAALVPGIALYVGLTVPGVADTLATPLGRFVLLPLAAVLETAGILLSRHIVQDLT
jgi:Flp pilus assembly protein TadB